MSKLALIVLLVLAALIWFRIKARGESTRDAATPAGKPEAMLTCMRCGVHLPSSEVIADNAGQTFCSVEHRDSAAGTP